MSRVKLLLAVSVCGLLMAGAAPNTKDDFDRARALAKKNENTAAGREYDRKLATHFEQNNGPVMTHCFDTTRAPDTRNFEMVFRVSEAGKIVEARVWPETNIGTCFREGVLPKSLPEPPEDGYWALMDMQMQ